MNMKEQMYDIEKVRKERNPQHKSNWKRDQCELHCKAIARLRARNRCEFSGVQAESVHHVFFGQWEGNWKARFNHLFFIVLCDDRHLRSLDAPHVNNKLFFKTLQKKLFIQDDDRLVSIMTFKDRPDRNPGRPDYDALLRELKAVRRSYEEVAWMDDYNHVASGVFT